MYPILEELMKQFQVSDEQKKAARNQALVYAGLGLLGTPKGREWQRLGASGMHALDHYNQGLLGAQQDNARKFQLGQYAQKMEAEQKKAEAAAAYQQEMAGAFQPQSAGPAAGPAAAPQSGGQAAMYRQAALVAARNGNDEAAKRLSDIADKMEEQGNFDTTVRTGMEGSNPYHFILNKRGEEKRLNAAPLPDSQVVNLGGTQQVIDKLRTAPGTSFNVTMTPDQIENNKIARANLGLRAEQNRIAQDANNAMREVGGGQAQRELGKLVTDLRKEYNGLEPVKNFRQAAPIAASAAQAPDTPAGDLDLIYAVGKVLDPGSVVREGEMNLVIKSGSPLQRLNGYVRMISQGKGRLPPAQREQLLEMLTGRMGQLKTAHDRAAAPFVQQAQRMNLPMAEVFGEEPKAATGGLTPEEAAELEQLRKRFRR